jgi:hypothetical protein
MIQTASAWRRTSLFIRNLCIICGAHISFKFSTIAQMKHPSTGGDITCILHRLQVNYKHKHGIFSHMLGLDFTSFSFVMGGAPEVYCG